MGNQYLRTLLAGALMAGIATAPVLAATAAEVVKSRVERYKGLGASFKRVNDEFKKGSPDAKIIQVSAREIAGHAREQYKWFPRGSGPQAGVTTKAKAEIWTNAAGFKKAQDAFAGQAAAFQKAAASGNIAQMRSLSKSLGGTCSACHRQFREES